MRTSWWKQIQRMIYQFNLDRLADLHKTDKGSSHGYTKVYGRFLRPYKTKPSTLIVNHKPPANW